MDFSYLIILWYEENKRDLPWRHTGDPYLIWVSEVILQQTRVEQGLAYYHRFVDRFPDIDSLADAEEEEVMKLWQGLGYYTRARNMHGSAKRLKMENDSKFPASYDTIRLIKGVGDYSASAISSIVYGEPNPVVDGNVLRVMSRFEGITEPVNSAACKKKIKDILNNYIDRDQPGTFNQAVMELGALVCKPKQPRCEICPVREHCFAFKHKRVADFPVISVSKPAKTRFFYYLVIISDTGGQESTWLRKRTEKDIWKNLYDFPIIELESELPVSSLKTQNQWGAIFGDRQIDLLPDPVRLRHKLSHQELRAIFIQIHTSPVDQGSYVKVNISDIHKYPVPRLIENYFKKIGW